MAAEAEKERIELLKRCETGQIADAYVRMGMARTIGDLTVDGSMCKPLNFADTLAGPVVTVRFAPLSCGKGMGLFDVLKECAPGSVVVMTGIPDRCYLGDVLARYAAIVGVSGIVAEGFIRDSKGCASCGIPVFSKGGTAAAKGKEMYAIEAVGEPISFHGIQLCQGDFLVGDCDGIIRIPPELLDAVCVELAEVLECERMYEDVFAKFLRGGIEAEKLLPKLKAVSAKSH